MSGTIVKICLVCVLVAGTGGLVAWGAGAFDAGAETPVMPRSSGGSAPMTDAAAPAKGDSCCPVSGKGPMPGAEAAMDGTSCSGQMAMDGADACTAAKPAIAAASDAGCGDKASCGSADACCGDCSDKASCGSADADCGDCGDKASCESKPAGCGSKGSCEVEQPIDN